ncbi:hypothetical protein SASPL_134733 [Salvia splendens]|uniref:(+)-piperitol/(+)-sesamin synthase n=1 Tax=Salvia splendens TaxID=180675 RepID=A0A8X8ZET4_SALSN|nr:cytochrome P450 81Q32-like [Salvia splendens]KAG6402537.1 hypothetical protein SASPL_134733 [Salvia splendens]
MEISHYLIYIPLLIPLFIFTKHLLHKLQNLPPSPLLRLPFLGHLHLLKKPLHRSLAAISSRHGPVVLLHLGSRRVLLVSSPSAAADCLSKNDVVFANRPRLLVGKHLGYNNTSLVWSSYGDHWRNLRKVSSLEVLSAQRLTELQGIRAGEVRTMVRTLARGSEERRLVDMKAAFFEVTMNVVMRMIAGKAYYGRGVEGAEEGRRFREIVAETMRLMAASNKGDYLPWLGDGGVEKRMVELHRERDSFMQELVEGCRMRRRSYGGDGGGNKTMIEMLLALQEKEPEYYTDELIKSLMLSLLIAGTDTSSGTMEWALSLMLNNPHVLKKAQAEIDGHVGHVRLLDESDLADLPYLRSVIAETLRMYPAAPLLVPHESSAECTVGGYRVPAGTMLLVNVWAIQNDPGCWEDATEFRPERFEKSGGGGGGCKRMPFGAGRRRCPGEALAVRVLGLGLGAVVQCFDWEREGAELVDMSEGGGVSLPRAAALMAYCRERSVAEALLSNI